MPQPDARRADAFLAEDVAAAYRARPPYPAEVIDRLAELACGGRVLDLGAGEGSLARPLSERVESVHAVERSQSMIAVGRGLPGGSAVFWHRATAESFELPGPYDLVVVGEAMHWFDLPVVVARLRTVLRPGAPVALVDRVVQRMPEIVEVIKRFSRAPDYDATYDVARDLTDRGLWHESGRFTPEMRPFRQRPESHLASLRSTASLARSLMTGEENAAFDAAVLDVMRPATDAAGVVTVQVTARLVWGTLR